jgi:hypothetical protein
MEVDSCVPSSFLARLDRSGQHTQHHAHSHVVPEHIAEREAQRTGILMGKDILSATSTASAMARSSADARAISSVSLRRAAQAATARVCRSVIDLLY